METETLPKVLLERVMMKPKKGQTFLLVRNPLDDDDDDGGGGDYKPELENESCSFEEEAGNDDGKPLVGYVLRRVL